MQALNEARSSAGGDTARAPSLALPLKVYFLLLVAAVLVPILAFAGILMGRYYANAIERVGQALAEDTRRLALSVDRDLDGLEATLRTLAVTSEGIASDYAAFHARAIEVRSLIGIDILIRDLSGQHRANTRVPFGTELPLGPLVGDEDVVRTQRPYISNLLTGSLTRRPVLTITVPLMREGAVDHFVNLSLGPEHFERLLEPNVDHAGAAGLIDRAGIVIAQLPGGAGAVGTRAPQGFGGPRGGEAIFRRGEGPGGQPAFLAFARSQRSGWTVWTATPEATVLAPLRETMTVLAALGLVLTALGLLLAYALSLRLGSAMRALTAAGAAIGRDERIPALRTALVEANAVGQALADASAGLEERARQRDAAEALLRALNARLEGEVAERTEAVVAEMRKREAAEGQLRQAQKIEAVGQLTGGIAHDFNNMLAVILSSLQLMRRRLAKGDTKVERFVEGAIEGAERAASLTRRLLAFSRQQALTPTPIDVNKLVNSMAELLRRAIPETIVIETVVAGGIWPAHADPNQLEACVLNLVVNARDAMPDGGKLTLETANAYLDEAYAATHADVSPGQFVMIAITDTGRGMPEGVAERAFEPFYTTKPPGQGTGLGLSQVYGFLKQSGGHVKIYSEPGHGTTVKLYLPRYLGAMAGATPREGGAGAPAPGAADRELVLVVEDEARVRALTVETLTELGYRVLDADGGEKALRLLEANPGIALLFTDVVMPGMNGRKLADEALKRRPELKVLFTTGYTRNAIVHNGVLDPGVHLIAKPFTLQAVGAKIREVLGEKVEA